MTKLSNIFAHLPNGIIRNIVSYTGATYKKRNGKYIRQIPKDDPRYAILHTIPKRYISYVPYSEQLPWSYATSYIELKNNYDGGFYMFYSVSVKTYPNENREKIGYYHIIQTNNTGQRRRYAHEVEGTIYEK